MNSSGVKILDEYSMLDICIEAQKYLCQATLIEIATLSHELCLAESLHPDFRSGNLSYKHFVRETLRTTQKYIQVAREVKRNMAFNLLQVQVPEYV